LTKQTEFMSDEQGKQWGFATPYENTQKENTKGREREINVVGQRGDNLRERGPRLIKAIKENGPSAKKAETEGRGSLRKEEGLSRGLLKGAKIHCQASAFISKGRKPEDRRNACRGEGMEERNGIESRMLLKKGGNEKKEKGSGPSRQLDEGRIGWKPQVTSVN